MFSFSVPAAILLSLQLVSALPTLDRRAGFDVQHHRNADGSLSTVFPLPIPVTTTKWAMKESLNRRNEGSDSVTTLMKRSSLSKRGQAASPCSLLDLDDVQQLPGYAQLEQHARDTWGEGDWTITINPAGYKDKPATMCVADPVIVIQTGDPVCNQTRVDIQPDKHDHIKVDEGYTNRGNWNITNVTEAAHAIFFSGNFQMPNITNMTTLDSIQTMGMFINAPLNSFVTTASNVTIKDTQVTPVPDKRCIGTINEQTCIIPARGRIQLVATGYIWFTYKTKRAPLATPNSGKHKRYTVRIEDVLKNATDRSAWIDFNGYMNTTMRTDYFDECRWNFKL
ncbi:hypothetical protein B0H34DRAFT_797857 [Crassisporium funariophilum]|nr:hypothetical protein B0H34DRAFT_797857 [Crassisporium funariophilum]